MARTAQAPEAPRASRPLVRDMTGTGSSTVATAPEVLLEARPAVDFVVSLMLDTEPELLPADQDWLAASRASLSDALRRDLTRVIGDGLGSEGIGRAIAPLVVEAPEVRTVADVLALAARLTARDLVRSCCDGEETRAAVDLAIRVLDGEPDQRDAAVAAWPESYRAGIGRLLDDPGRELRALRRILRAWSERFAPIEPRIAAMEQRDVDARRADVDRFPLADLVERITGGVRWSPDPATRRLVLSPSYFARPYNYVFGGRDWHMFAYPLADAALGADADAAPAASLRLFKALGDESRLRILRLLASGDLYLTEIADRMGLSKATISHHLAQLRAAGLVTITQAGTLTYYSLRRDRIADASDELATYLGSSSR